MLHLLTEANERINNLSTYSKDKSDKLGEVFTPVELIDEILDKLPPEIWSDPTKTFFDPCAGKGNFGIRIALRLFEGLTQEIPNEYERLRHVIENQLYFAELQPESCNTIREVFSFGQGFKVNLYEGDTLQMPTDYFV